MECDFRPFCGWISLPWWGSWHTRATNGAAISANGITSSHMSRLAKRGCDCAVLRTAFTLAVDSTIAYYSHDRPRNHILFICLTAINVCKLDLIKLKGSDRLGCWVPSNASLCYRLFEGCVLQEHVAKEGGSIWRIEKWKAGEVPGLLALCLQYTVPPYPPLPPYIGMQFWFREGKVHPGECQKMGKKQLHLVQIRLYNIAL